MNGLTASFEAIARRERCPFAVVGRLTADGVLRIADTGRAIAVSSDWNVSAKPFE